MEEKVKEKKVHNLIEVSSKKELFIFLIGFLSIVVVTPLIYLLIAYIIKVTHSDTSIYSTIVLYGNLVIYILVLIGLLLFLGKDLLIKVFSGFKKGKNIGLGVLGGVVIIVVEMLLNIVTNLVIGNGTSNDNNQAVQTATNSNPYVTFIVTVLIAPIVEEITYRLGLFGVLHKKNKVLAYLVSALVFALIHTVFIQGLFDGRLYFGTLTSTQYLKELLSIPTYFFSGLVFAFLYEKTDSVATSMTAHLSMNLFAYLSMLISSLISKVS